MLLQVFSLRMSLIDIYQAPSWVAGTVSSNGAFLYARFIAQTEFRFRRSPNVLRATSLLCESFRILFTVLSAQVYTCRAPCGVRYSPFIKAVAS